MINQRISFFSREEAADVNEEQTADKTAKMSSEQKTDAKTTGKPRELSQVVRAVLAVVPDSFANKSEMSMELGVTLSATPQDAPELLPLPQRWQMANAILVDYLQVDRFCRVANSCV